MKRNQTIEILLGVIKDEDSEIDSEMNSRTFLSVLISLSLFVALTINI